MIKLFEGFAGAGMWQFGLKEITKDFECVGYSEFDKFAIQCYKQNHCKLLEVDKLGLKHLTPHNYGDITKIIPKQLPDFDIGCFSPPCQTFSIAGKGLGNKEARGQLFEPSINIIKIKQPKVAIFENVKGLVSKRHKEYFDYLLKLIDDAWYNVNWKVLNTKNYGIPQNRERVFIVCIRKDINVKFEFPQEEELKIFLKDILEDEVDEKYYLKEEIVNKLLYGVNSTFRTRNLIKSDVCQTLQSAMSHGNTIPLIIKNNYNKIVQVNNPRHSNNRVYSSAGDTPALNTMQGGNRQPFIVASRGRNINNPSDRTPGNSTVQRLEPKLDGTTNTITSVQKDNYVMIKNATKTGYLKAEIGDGVSLEHPNSKTRRGRVQLQSSPTLQCNDSKGVITQDLRIRKLTPKECYRLQGFLRDQINLDGISNTQKYKIAGNGLSINVVEKIFRQIFKLDIFKEE